MKKQIPSPTTQINVLRRYLHVLALLQNNKDPKDWNACTLADMLSRAEPKDSELSGHNIQKYIQKYLIEELGIEVDVVKGGRRTGLAKPLDEDLLHHIADIYSSFVVTDTTRGAILSALIKKHRYDALWILARLHFAIIMTNIISFDYAPHGKKSRRTYRVNPYHLVFRNNNLYLVGLNDYRRNTSLFIINKIENLKILDDTFHEAIPDIKHIFKDSLGSFIGKPMRVVIRFSESVYSQIEQVLNSLNPKIKKAYRRRHLRGGIFRLG